MTDNKCLSNLDINMEWLPKLHTKDENNRYYSLLSSMISLPLVEFYKLLSA